MTTVWTPANISPICQHEQAQLDQCSPGGFAFLSLVAQLFGHASYSISYTGASIYPSDVQLLSETSSTEVSNVPQNFALNGYSENIPSNPIFPFYSNNYPHDQGYDDSNYFSNFNDFGPGSYNEPLVNYQSIEYRKGSLQTTKDTDTTEPTEAAGGKVKTELPVIENVTTGTIGEETEKKSSRSRYYNEYQEYDFIIVGGGSAGCVMANRLSEIKQWNILLIEAGPEEPDVTMVPGFPPILRGSSIDWNYRTQPEPLTCRGLRNNECPWPRGKTMGGSSAINYLIYMRGNKLDYDDWAEMGNPGWSYSEILPYFRKSENNRNIERKDTIYHGDSGPLNVERYPYTDKNTVMLVEAFKERGLPVRDLTLPDNFGTNIVQSTSKNGRRFSANLAYIRPIRNVRPNLSIITNAFVTKIIIDPYSKIAKGVTFYRNGVYQNVYARKEVIISGGTFNSPKLLMLSGIGIRNQLENLNIQVLSDLQVGQNLQEHATAEGFVLAFSNKTSTELNIIQLMNEVINYRQQDTFNNGPLSTTSTLNAVAFIKTRYASANAPDIQYHFDAINAEQFFKDPETSTLTSNTVLPFSNGVTVRPILLTPRSRGQILLNTTDPVFGQPLIYPGFFTVRSDMDTLVEGMRFALTLEQTEAFQRNGARFVRTPVRGCEDHVWASYDYFACLFIKYTSIIFHPVGTCKMGPRWDKTAVVDPRLLVYGIKNLRVIDASIMPKTIRGNTNAPVMMIAERASDMIKEDWFSI